MPVMVYLMACMPVRMPVRMYVRAPGVYLGAVRGLAWFIPFFYLCLSCGCSGGRGCVMRQDQA